MIKKNTPKIKQNTNDHNTKSPKHPIRLLLLLYFCYKRNYYIFVVAWYYYDSWTWNTISNVIADDEYFSFVLILHFYKNKNKNKKYESSYSKFVSDKLS